MQKRHTFFYIISPLFFEWVLTYIVQIVMLAFAPELLNDALIYTTVASIAIIPVMYGIYRKDEKKVVWKSDNNITWVTILGVVMLGITTCTMLNILIGLSGIYKFSEQYQEISSIIYDASKPFQIFALVIVAPVLEELVYRGLVYRRMREMGPVVPAVVISALVFGINHGNIVQFIFAAAIGMLLALVYEKYKKIGIPIILHMSVNLSSLLWTWVGELL